MSYPPFPLMDGWLLSQTLAARHHRAAFSFQGVRKATQITAMHIIAKMATPIHTE